MVASSVADKTDKSSIYDRILETAEIRNDINMITRLRGVVNRDLVAVEARYHRKKNCVSSYINTRNIAAKQKSSTNIDIIHDRAIVKLIDEFRPKIECNEVFLLSTLRTSYLQHLKDMNEEYHCMYTSQKLKVKL